MRRFLQFIAIFVLAFFPSTINAQNSVSSVNVGPHGNDWYIGMWTCKNNTRSAMVAAQVITTTALRSRSSPSDIFYRETGQGFDASGYLHYDANSKTWWNPVIFSNGTAVSESTRQTGKNTVWNGTITDASGTRNIRDSYVQVNMRMFTDLTEIQSGGAWKTIANASCTKS